MSLQLSLQRTALLVVDIQERLASAIPEAVLEQVVRNTVVLVETANRLGLPVVVTEQYPKGLGQTVPAINLAVEAVQSAVHRFAKTCFSAASCDEFSALAPRLGRDQWVVAGMETHICVYQTARGLIDRGYQVHVVADAVCSRTKANYKIGRKLAERAGAVLTSTETVVFDLLGRAGTDDFKALSKLIK